MKTIDLAFQFIVNSKKALSLGSYDICGIHFSEFFFF